MTQTALGAAVGLRQPAVVAWEMGDNVPAMEVVFGLERALGVRPGALSKHLGYLPLDAVKTVCSLRQAIEEDTGLSDAEKRALLTMVNTMQDTRRASARVR